MSSINQLSYLYNPANQTDEQLLNGFVVRSKPLQKILRELTASKLNSTSQHILIEAQRGMGKTSLLLRLRIEIERNPKLSHLLAVQLAEEQYGVYNLCQLWEHVAEALEDSAGFETLADEMDDAADRDDYPQECFTLLENYLKRNQRKLVLLLDNVGDMLKRFSETETNRLRDIFYSSSSLQLTAASAKVLEATYRQDHPVYECFRVIHLKGLDKKDTYKLLEKLAENDQRQQQIQQLIKTQRARIETIRRLTGGVPRTLILLYEIFMDESTGVFEDLEMILDRVSPLYKHRMDDLANQQQAIMNTLALNWDGMTTKEITAKLNDATFTSKKVAAQLKQLEKNALVESRLIDKKNKVYLLQERFFNIWYLMRYGRKKNKMQVLWLVRFLQEWCDQDELVHRAKQHIVAAQEGRLNPRGGVYMTEALAPLIDDMDLQHQFITSSREALRTTIGDIDKKISVSDRELYGLAEKAQEDKNFKLAIKHYKTLADKGYIEPYRRIALIYKLDYKDINLATIHYKIAIQYGSAEAMFGLGVLYHLDSKNIDQAIVYYKMAIEKGYSNAMHSLALLYQRDLKDIEQAMIYYKMAIEKDEAWAMFGLAHLYQYKLKDIEQAIIYYKMAIEKDHAEAMFNLAHLYQYKLKDIEQAIVYYKMAIEKDHFKAINNLASLYYEELKDIDQAMVYYQMAIKKDDIKSMTNLANLYQYELKDTDQAMIYYQMAIEKGDVNAMKGLAGLYYEELKDIDQAIVYCQMAVEKDDVNAMNGLTLLYYTQAIEKEAALTLSKKAILLEKNILNIYILAITQLWNNHYQTSIDSIKEFFASLDDFQEYIDDITDYFLLLIAKQQYQATYDLFQQFSHLQQQFKPVYYALMTLLKDQYPKDYLKMGNELEETVQEILQQIEQKAVRYR